MRQLNRWKLSTGSVISVWTGCDDFALVLVNVLIIMFLVMEAENDGSRLLCFISLSIWFSIFVVSRSCLMLCQKSVFALFQSYQTSPVLWLASMVWLVFLARPHGVHEISLDFFSCVRSHSMTWFRSYRIDLPIRKNGGPSPRNAAWSRNPRETRRAFAISFRV